MKKGKSKKTKDLAPKASKASKVRGGRIPTPNPPLTLETKKLVS